MQEQNPIVEQIEERIRRLEAELAQLKATGSEKKNEIRQHRRALKVLGGDANQHGAQPDEEGMAGTSLERAE